jgi:hypothetical protein
MPTEQKRVLPKPVDWDELYPGRFLKASEFKGKKVTLRIAEVRIEELVGDKGPQIKGVIGFEKTEKQWALNKTNGFCLREMFGRKVQEWVGKQVTLFPSQFDGEDCIRVWGSPELEADKQVVIALPRRRPFEMTMHRVSKAAASSPSEVRSGGADSGPDAIAHIKATESLDAYAKARKAVWALYADAGKAIPVELEAAANEHREALEERAGMQEEA